jgi:hypothetical protein
MSMLVFAKPSIQTTKDYRNYVANNWSYHSRGVYQNNYLAYALGNTTSWVWPWVSSNPTLNTVKTYMRGRGYAAIDKNFIGAVQPCQIMAYGRDSGITHFSRMIFDTSGSFTKGSCRA